MSEDIPEDVTRMGRSADTLMRDGEDSFVEKYSRHDVGELYVRQVIHDMGLHASPWGIDARDSGDEDLISDDRMDFKVYYDPDMTDLAALIDVKTKGRPHWMGKFNLRHYRDYRVHKDAFGVPTFVIFCLLDDEEDSVIDVQCVPIEEHTVHDAGRSFPDGNRMATAADATESYGWEVFQSRVNNVQ